jgi:hypothetical protein
MEKNVQFIKMGKDLTDSFISIFKYGIVLSFIASFIMIVIIMDIYDYASNTKIYLILAMTGLCLTIANSGFGILLTLIEKSDSIKFFPIDYDDPTFIEIAWEWKDKLTKRRKVILFTLAIMIFGIIWSIFWIFLFTYKNIGDYGW